MHYGTIKTTDIANGPGVRVSLFVSGCRNRCADCFQPQTWAFDYGSPFDDEAQEAVITALAPDYIRGLTVLGGEPMEPENQAALLPFLEQVRRLRPDKDIWCYTGFTYEELKHGSRASGENAARLLSLIDVLVDGRFVREKKNLSLPYRGSENQRIIDLKATSDAGHLVFWTPALC